MTRSNFAVPEHNAFKVGSWIHVLVTKKCLQSRRHPHCKPFSLNDIFIHWFLHLVCLFSSLNSSIRCLLFDYGTILFISSDLNRGVFPLFTIAYHFISSGINFLITINSNLTFKARLYPHNTYQRWTTWLRGRNTTWTDAIILTDIIHSIGMIPH